MFKSVTISDRMRLTGARTSGFDYLRFSLAASIILWHGIVVSYGQQVELQYWRGPIGVAYHFVLPVFFALSGFLVAGSLDRCPTLVSFCGLRALRIVPALSVEVALSAIIAGPLLTSLPLRDYFADSRFAPYFLNIIGDIHFLLPGLFEHNPYPAIVNAQLWTIPYELMCYLALGGLAVAGTLRRRLSFTLLVLALQALWAFQALRRGDDGTSNGASGEVLLIAFLAGIVLHLYRDRVPLHAGLFAAVCVIATLLSMMPHGSYYLPFPAAYMTVYLGLLNPPHSRFLRSGDYSYGLYLYGFPLQQAVASFGPAAQHWWVNVALAFPAALLVAACSWHFVERPALSARKHLPAFEAACVGWLTARRRDGPPVWIDRAFMVAVFAGGPAGTILLVDGHEVAGSLTVALTFAAAMVLGAMGVRHADMGGSPLLQTRAKNLLSPWLGNLPR